MVCNTAVILAAGAGTRMKSSLPKVLHKVCGRPMIEHVINQVRRSGVEDIILVVGHGAEGVVSACTELGVRFAVQEEQLGTGHAVMQARELLPENGDVLILCGDTPLITGEGLAGFMEFHREGANDASVLTAELAEPYGYGRIIRDSRGGLVKIVEQKDADENEKQVREINSGIFCFNAAILKSNLTKLKTDNSQNEYYITDVLGIAVREGGRTGAYLVADAADIAGINTRVQLADAERVMRGRIAERHMLAGVTMIDPGAVYLDDTVEIGPDTVLYPGAFLTGKSVVGQGCVIGQNSRIEDSIIGDGVEVQSSTIIRSSVGDGSSIGPYAYLRPDSRIGKKVKIGDFVEVKNAIIGDYSKASHLSYIGDADVGRNVNIGCGVVFVNYDGKKKYRSTVRDGAFVGSNCNLVAPVVIEENAYVAAGTTVTRNVPNGSLCLGRVKEKHIEGWVQRKNLLREVKED